MTNTLRMKIAKQVSASETSLRNQSALGT